MKHQDGRITFRASLGLIDKLKELSIENKTSLSVVIRALLQKSVEIIEDIKDEEL